MDLDVFGFEILPGPEQWGFGKDDIEVAFGWVRFSNFKRYWGGWMWFNIWMLCAVGLRLVGHCPPWVTWCSLLCASGTNLMILVPAHFNHFMFQCFRYTLACCYFSRNPLLFQSIHHLYTGSRTLWCFLWLQMQVSCQLVGLINIFIYVSSHPQ